MLMSEILNESKADKAIIKSLLGHIKKLERRINMSEAKILFDINGDAYRVTEFEVLSEGALNHELKEAQAEAKKIEEAIAYSNKLQSTAPQGEETPAPVVPEAPVAPVVPEAPVTPEVPSTPEVQPEQPAPAVDPATAPAPTNAPIVLQ